MGCGQSKIDKEEVVYRCRARKRLMADAVFARNAFAAAHTGYSIDLRRTGAALSDFAHGEAPDPSLVTSHTHHVVACAVAASVSALPGPSTASIISVPSPQLPPQSAHCSHPSLSSTPNIRSDSRAASKNHSPADASIREEDEDEEENDEQIRNDNNDDHDHRDFGNVSVKGTVHGQPSKQVLMDIVGSSKATQLPPSRLNQTPPTALARVQESQVATCDHLFGQPPMPPPTQEQPTNEVWMERCDKEQVAEVKVPVAKLVVSETAAAEERVPQMAAEKEKANEMVANLPLVKPIVRKPPKAPGPLSAVKCQHASSMDAVENQKGEMTVASGTASLLQIFSQLDDHFLRASESAHDVSKKLEANRMHYHSNHADSRGYIDHSTKIVNIITWNRSFKNLPDHEDLNSTFEIDDRFETIAAVLDRMLAWEKKLYDEVKAGELMKIDYQKQVAILQKQKNRGVKLQTKASFGHLRTRYIIDMQSMDSTVSEINRLRDRQLFPMLVDLVDGMAKMWSAMHRYHRRQFLIISGIKGFEIPPVPRETTDLHYENTCELHASVRYCHWQFEKLMDHQKEYIRALNAWLKLNLVPIERNITEKVSSPPRLVDPPIKHLLYTWHDELEKLPIELAKTAIKTFDEVILDIIYLQEEEVKVRRRRDKTRRDLNQKRAQGTRKRAIEKLEVRLREEEEQHLSHARQVREKSLTDLQAHLPEFFRNMADFSYFCHNMYKNLKINAALLKDEVQG